MYPEEKFLLKILKWGNNRKTFKERFEISITRVFQHRLIA